MVERKHFHCKNAITAGRRSRRLAQEGWLGSIEPSKCGLILYLVEKVAL